MPGGVKEVVGYYEVDAVPAEGVDVVGQHHARLNRSEVRREAHRGRSVGDVAAAAPLLRRARVHAACARIRHHASGVRERVGLLYCYLLA